MQTGASVANTMNASMISTIVMHETHDIGDFDMDCTMHNDAGSLSAAEDPADRDERSPKHKCTRKPQRHGSLDSVASKCSNQSLDSMISEENVNDIARDIMMARNVMKAADIAQLATVAEALDAKTAENGVANKDSDDENSGADLDLSLLREQQDREREHLEREMRRAQKIQARRKNKLDEVATPGPDFSD